MSSQPASAPLVDARCPSRFVVESSLLTARFPPCKPRPCRILARSAYTSPVQWGSRFKRGVCQACLTSVNPLVVVHCLIPSVLSPQRDCSAKTGDNGNAMLPRKSSNFKDTRQKIYVPLAMSANLRKKSFKLVKNPEKKHSWANLGPTSA